MKKLARNFSALVTVQFISYVLPLITLPVIARIIGPEKFGIINYLSSFVGYFILIIGYSFELSATRLITTYNDDSQLTNLIFNKVFFTKIALFIICSVAFFCLFFFFPNLLEDKLVAIFTFLLCISAVFDSTWLFTAKQDLHHAAIFNLVTKVLLNVSLLFFIRVKQDYIYQPLIVGLSQILVGYVAFAWAMYRYNLKLKFPELSEIWELLWKNRFIFFHSFSYNVFCTINIVILGFLRGSLEVGYYTAGWKLVMLIHALIITPLSIVLFPVTGEAFGRNKEDGIVVIQKMLPLFVIVTLFMGIGILLFGGTGIRLLYGNEFSKAVSTFKLMAFIPMMGALNMLFGVQTMVNLKMDGKIFLITLSATFLSLLINLVLITYLGADGAAISWFISELFCTVAMFIVLAYNNVKLLKYEYFTFAIMRNYLFVIAEKAKIKFKKPTINNL